MPNEVENPAAQMDAQNRFFQSLVARLETPGGAAKSVPCEVYKIGTDFDLWVPLFVDTVKAVHNLTTTDQARINALCTTWLPTKLQAGETRSVYENLPPAVKQNWPDLKAALSKAFRDEAEEIEFINNEAAWVRTPGMPLRDYKNGLTHRLDKYQPHLRNINQEWQRAAVRRFRAGLKNDVLSAHILMTCVNNKHTLDDAYSVACNFENTLKTIAQSGNNTVAPTLAAMLPIPQIASVETTTQLGALNSRADEKMEALETAMKKSELDMSELRSGLLELKETVKELREDIVTLNNRSLYPRQTRPYFPVSRMPLQGASSRQYGNYQQPRQTLRQQNTVPGLTNGPGYVNNNLSQSSVPRPQVNQSSRNVPDPFGSRMGRGITDAKLLQRTSAPTLGAVEGVKDGQDSPEVQNGSFSNPNLQYGLCDMGEGWVNFGGNEDGDDFPPMDPPFYPDSAPPFY